VAREHTFCIDCGINAWRFREGGRMVHEDFYVSSELWRATCPDNGVIFIGCFKARLGRQLTRDDFTLRTDTKTNSRTAVACGGSGRRPLAVGGFRMAVAQHRRARLEAPHGGGPLGAARLVSYHGSPRGKGGRQYAVA
jgi:hypothetical protein